MLAVTQLSGFGGGGRLKLISILRSLNLTSGLLFCLDAGDSDSYSGTGQTWNDVSGSANHFNRGTTSGSDSTDPTFNGSAGALSESEYFSSDGGDFFRLASGTFDDGWSQNNGAYTFLVVAWPDSFAANVSLFGNCSNASRHDGTTAYFNTSEKVSHNIDTADAAGTSTNNSTASAVAQKPNLVIVGWDEATPTGKIKLNANALQTPSWSASTLTNAAGTLEILASGAGQNIAPASTRVYMAAAWSSLLSDASIDALAQTLRNTRFPNMP